jgi:hypothetical protein
MTSCFQAPNDPPKCLHYSLFAENGVIIRNLNYRPWQWVIAFPVAKVFLAVFNKLIE